MRFRIDIVHTVDISNLILDLYGDKFLHLLRRCSQVSSVNGNGILRELGKDLAGDGKVDDTPCNQDDHHQEVNENRVADKKTDHGLSIQPFYFPAPNPLVPSG